MPFRWTGWASKEIRLNCEELSEKDGASSKSYGNISAANMSCILSVGYL